MFLKLYFVNVKVSFQNNLFRHALVNEYEKEHAIRITHLLVILQEKNTIRLKLPLQKTPTDKLK